MKIKDHFLTKEAFEIIPSNIDGVMKTSPLPADLQKYYQSEKYISHHQDKGGIKEAVYKFLQKFNLNFKRNVLAAVLSKGAKVLDYGCGAGEFLKFIEEDFTTFGFEPNAEAKRAAQAKTARTTFQDSVETFQEGELQAITLWHVFEHIPEPENMLKKFYKKLSADGKLVIAVPNYKSYDAQKYKNFWAAYDVPRHLFHYSQTGMRNILAKNNFKIVQTKPLLLDAFYISILSEKYLKNPFFPVFGAIIGAISNFKASKNGEFSSMIYIVEKIQKTDF